MEKDEILGKTLEEARIICRIAGVPNRVTSVDGNAMGITDDFVPERMNFTIEKDIITKITFE